MSYRYYLIFSCLPLWVFGQVDVQNRTSETLDFDTRSLDESSGVGIGFQWDGLLQKPNLNAVKSSVFRYMGFSNFQIFNLKSFLKRNRHLISFDVLREVKGWDSVSIAKVSDVFELRPVQSEKKWNHLWAWSRHVIITRSALYLPRASGYLNSKFLGNPWFTSLNYRGNFSNVFSVYLGMEKDAGEPSYWDFLTGSLEMGSWGYLSKVILGDYHVTLGQGVALWNAFGFGKGVHDIQVARLPGGIFAKKSPTESPFFRGLAVQGSINSWDAYLFLSRKGVSARTDTLRNTPIFRTLSENTRYRDASSASIKSNLSRTDFGLSLRWSSDQSYFGLLHYRTMFDAALQPDADLFYDQRFSGSQLDVTSFHYSSMVANALQFFGESATQGEHLTHVHGLTLEQSTHAFTVLYRDYPVGGRYFYSQSFSENKTPERGIYLSFLGRFPHGITASFYMDLYHSTGLSYPNILPYYGRDFRYTLTQDISPNLTYLFRFRYELRERHVFLNPSPDEEIWRFRCQMVWTGGDFRLKWRIDTKKLFGDRTLESMVFVQDLYYTGEGAFSYKFRVAIFDVPHWDVRIYSLSPSLPQSFYSVVFYGRGTHFSGVVSYKLTEQRTTLGFQIAQFGYWGENTLSQGDDEIRGNQKFYLAFRAAYHI